MFAEYSMEITFCRAGGQVVIASIQSKIRDSNAVDHILTRARAVVDHGTIPMKDLLEIFEEYEVYLDTRECELIDRRFISPNGNIEYNRLMKILDFGLPQDHMDPDHFADPLPQPYRMIAKILELEIIDNAWNEILRRYPEVHEDIPGRGTIVRRNRNLDVECFASSQSDRSKPITAMVSGGKYVYTINTAGSFVVVDNTTGKFLQTLQVFPEEYEPNLLRVHMSNASSSSSNGSSRIAVLKIQDIPPVVEQVDLEAEKKKAAAAKKAPKGKNAPPPEPEPVKKAVAGYKCSVSLVDVSGDSSSSIECKFVHTFDCLVHHYDVHVDMSDDGRALLICHGLEISLFKFPAMSCKVGEDPFAQKMHDIHEHHEQEEGEDVDHDHEKPADPITPPLCQWNMKDEILKYADGKARFDPGVKSIDDDSAVLSCHIFPFKKELSWDDGAPDAADPNSVLSSVMSSGSTPAALNTVAMDHKDKHKKQFQNGLAVFMQEKKMWFVFGMRSGQPPEPPADVPASQASPESTLVPVLELLRCWTLSGHVTALDFDDKKTVVAIGQSDGMVSLWDLRSMQLLSAPGRHSTSITAISLTVGVDTHVMVSGDKDGVLCFYKLFSASSANAERSGRDTSVIPSSRPCLKAELVDFRMDFRDEVIKIWKLDGVSIVVVHTASGKLVVYDAEGSELLGRLCLTSGIPGQKLDYSFISTGDCVIDNRSLAVPEENEEGLPTESAPPPSPPKPKTAAQVHRERMGVGAGSGRGFCGYFSRVGMKTVLAMFSLDKMLSFLYPGIAALSEKRHTKDVELIVLYALLTPAQRMNPYVKISDVAGMDGGNDGSSVDSKSKAATTAKQALSRTGSRQNLGGTLSRKSSQLGGATGGITLTAEHLMQLEKKFMPFTAPTSPLPLASCAYGRMALPKVQFEQSVKISQVERAKRKNTILGSMQTLADLF
jgi:hypothetical protein